MRARATILLGDSYFCSLRDRLPLTPRNVQAVSLWAGSYHVRDMAGHFRDYFETAALPATPAAAGFPSAHGYVPLAFKLRAGGITGNTGEVAAAIFAQTCLGLRAGEIVLVKPAKQFAQHKAPDYMMRLDARGLLRPLLGNPTPPFPVWWPVESKARSAALKSNAREEAFAQLAGYWQVLALQATGSTCPELGYGMSVLTSLELPGHVEVCFYLPADPPSLFRMLKMSGAHRTMQRANFRGLIHGI